MAKNLIPEYIEKRFQEINAQVPEELTPEYAASLKVTEEMDDGSVVSLNHFKTSFYEPGEMAYATIEEISSSDDLYGPFDTVDELMEALNSEDI